MVRGNLHLNFVYVQNSSHILLESLLALVSSYFLLVNHVPFQFDIKVPVVGHLTHNSDVLRLSFCAC